MRTGFLRPSAILLLLAPLLLVGTGRALACVCVPASPAELLERSDVVFAGTVVAAGQSAGQPAKFRVSRVWKGAGHATRFVDVGGEITANGLVRVTSCDPQFSRGENHLVYASSAGSDAPLRTGYCSIAYLDHAQEHLEALGEGRAPEPLEALGEGRAPEPLEALGEGRAPEPLEALGEGRAPEPLEALSEGRAPEPLEALSEGRVPEPGTTAPPSASGSPLASWPVGLIAIAIALAGLGVVSLRRRT